MPRSAWLLRSGYALTTAALLASCASTSSKTDGPGSIRSTELPGDAVPRPEARSRYGNGRDLGNGPQYEVFNRTYTVMPSSHGYRERGVASWYGSKFHGNLTSNREVYDMHAMTAAHKTLPLPSYVKVRNLRNDREVIVRVNDRGPFVHNRIIDLSYAAALKLDMIRDGTSLVEVTAISFDASTSIDSTGTQNPAADTSQVATSEPAVATHRIFVQVGAFGDRNNAERRLDLLRQSGIGGAFIYDEHSTRPVFFKVRIGPIVDVAQYDSLVDRLENIGINDPYLISE